MPDNHLNKSSRSSASHCCIDKEDKQNASIARYLVKDNHQELSGADKFAYSQPSILYTDGHVDPDEIAEDSTLRFGAMTNKNYDTFQLKVRSNTVFMTECKDCPNSFGVPIGVKDVSIDTKLRNGETQFPTKCNIMDKQPNPFTPLIPSLKKEVQDPENIVQELSGHDFSRYGTNTRLDKKPFR